MNAMPLRLLLPLAVLPVVALGNAHLASNTVPTTHAGAVHVTVPWPTSLAVEPATLVQPAGGPGGVPSLHFLHLRATLSLADHAIAGETVTFKAGGVTLCSDTTDNSGVAHCPDDLMLPAADFATTPDSYTASFEDTAALAGSTDSAALRLIGDSRAG